MPSLLELQRGFRAALLGGDDRVTAQIAGDPLTAAERLGVYRNNILSSLAAALKGTFPVVCRLVDERFFAYAANEFIRAYPPAQPCLAEYGESFAGFLAGFPPCRELPYLADVARLEWAIHRAARLPETASLDLASLPPVAPDAVQNLRFRLRKACSYVSSPWPVDRIWRTNRGDDPPETIDLDAGGVTLEIRRYNGDVEMRRLPAAVFAFREAVSAGQTLSEAIDAGLAADDAFVAADALAALAGDGALTSITLDPGEFS